MAEEAHDNPPEDEVQIEGLQVQTPAGSMVWGARHEGSYLWRFVSPSGAETVLKLSPQAMQAVMRLYQQLAGIDIGEVEVGVEESRGKG